MKAITLIFAGMVFFNIHSQQEYSFTHYFETNSFYNPASTGSEQTQNIVGLFRKQWAGFTGSPTTGGLLNENKLKDYNMGVGGYVFTDKIGETCMTTATANYAYSLSFNSDLKLAFGIDAGADFITTNVDRLIYWDQTDQLLTNSKLSYVVPKVGLGTHLYNEKFYVGISVPRVLNFNSRDFHSIQNSNLPMVVSHYYLSAGYKFRINEEFAMKTNTLLKYTRDVQPQIDLNATCTYKEMIGLGFGYKSLGFISSYIQYTYDNTVTIGYAFDFSVNPIAKYAKGGTHELMIKYAIRPRLTSSKI